MLIFEYGFWANWENPQPITFDPENKLIWINSGVTSLDVGPDIYSNWKEWVLTYDNSKWAAAFYTFGGDPTSEQQTAPAYYFLTNGWKVAAYDVEVVIQTNLYSDDGLSPFVIDNAAVTNRTSDVPVVRTDVEKRLDYGDRIYVDYNSPYQGLEYPVGTIAQPVNNLSDATLIAQGYNITKMYLRSDININNSFNLNGFDFYGDINNIIVTSSITLSNILDDTRFYNLIIRGNFAGANTSILDSQINDGGVYDINGEISNTEINGEIKIDNNLVISNSFSGKAGTEPGLVVDMNSINQVSLSLRAYSGGVEIYNCTQSGDTSTIELIAGKVTLDNSCTDGLIDIRGVGYLVDNSSGTTVITTGLVDSFGTYLEETKELDEKLSYDNKLFIDPLSGTTGTTYPVGTAAVPVKGIYDLLNLSNTLNIKNIIVLEDIIIPPLPIVVDHFNISANVPNITLTIPNGYNAENSKITGFIIDEADMKGYYHHFIECVIGNVSGIQGLVEKCALDGHLYNSGSTIKILNTTTFLNCYPNIVHDLPYIELVNPSGVTTGFRKYSGGLVIDKMEHPDDFISIDLVAGHIIISSGCTNGTIELLGVGFLEDYSGSGVTVDTTGFISSTQGILQEIDDKVTYISGLTTVVDEKVDYIVGKTDSIDYKVTYISGATSGMTELLDIVDEKVDYISGITTETNIIVNDISDDISGITIDISGITETLTDIDNKVDYISGITTETNENVMQIGYDISGLTNIVIDIDNKVDYISGATSGITDTLIDIENTINYISGSTCDVTGITEKLDEMDTKLDYISGTTCDTSGITEQLDVIEGKLDVVSGLTIEMNDNVIYMTEQISGMTSGFTEITNAISGMTVQVEAMDAKLDYISGTTNEMNENVLIMTDQVSGMTEDMSGITEAIYDMEDTVNDLDAQVKRILGLTQENFRIMDQVYDPADNKLLSATIKIYSSAADTNNDVNPIETYNMTAIYDASCRLIDYKVIKI